MKNLGGGSFFSLFLPKVGGKFILISCFQLVNRIGVKSGGSRGTAPPIIEQGASNVICPPPPAEYTTTQTAKPTLDNEKYTRSVSLRNVCDYPPPPRRRTTN